MTTVTPMGGHNSDTGEVDDISISFAAGAPDALRQAYERFSPLVHTLALRALNDHHAAEEVTQAVFVSAWRGRHTLRPGPQALAQWIVGITRHRIADQQQQRYRLRRDEMAAAKVAAEPEHERIDQVVEDRIIVQDAVAELGDPRGMVIRMALMEGRSHREIADLLDMPIGTVKSHIRRGLIQLRDCLKEVHS